MALSRFLKFRSIRSAFRGATRYIFGKRGQRRVGGWRLYYRLRMVVMLMSQNTLESIAPFRDVRLWVDKEAFPRIEKLLSRAQHTVVIQMFIWKDDELGRKIANLLTTIADRGVKVYVTKEAVGDFFELEGDFLTTRDEKDSVWQRFWKHPNIRISYATNNDHAKVYIIDDKIMLLTGMNIANEYHESWHDYLVELHGDRFIQQYLTNGEISGPTKPVRLVMNAGARKDIRPAVMELLANARHSIVLEQCYLSDEEVINSLIERSKKGVSITIIIPADPDVHHYSNMQSIVRLMADANSHRLRVFLYPKIVHGKIILVDRYKAFVGSANMITSSLDEMGEVNVLMESRSNAAVEKLRDVLRNDILISRPLTSPPHLHWFQRLLSWVNL